MVFKKTSFENRKIETEYKQCQRAHDVSNTKEPNHSYAKLMELSWGPPI